jgi:hypothetical protein
MDNEYNGLNNEQEKLYRDVIKRKKDIAVAKMGRYILAIPALILAGKAVLEMASGDHKKGLITGFYSLVPCFMSAYQGNKMLKKKDDLTALKETTKYKALEKIVGEKKLEEKTKIFSF